MGLSASLLYILIALISVIVFYIKRQLLSFWKRHGIPHDEPHFPLGNLKKTQHLRDVLKDHYNKFKGTGPFSGFYLLLTPSVVILDLNLIKDILIKDFNNFPDRGIYNNPRDDPLSGHLFILDGPQWKHLRTKLSPTFTSGKIKTMFTTVVAIADQLLGAFNKILEKNSVVEVKDILARFTADVIGTCAFGIDCNSLDDPKAEFHIMGGKAFTLTRHGMLLEGFMTRFPELARKLGMRRIHGDVHDFFMRVVRDTVDYREKNSIKRNDFMNLLIEMKNTADGLTIEEIAAQAFVFFLGGFETSSSTMGFALFELALHQDIQDKLRAEINLQLEKNDGKLTYESMSEMHYMEKVIKESLRKYSILFFLERKALNDYPTSNPKYTIPKGTKIIIPSDAIHYDPKFYPDPEKFDPERFSPEEMQKRHPIAWLPFGDGPRNCIGLRFGKMQTYMGLATLLKNYKFHYCEKTPNPLVMDEKSPLMAVKGGIYLRVERI